MSRKKKRNSKKPEMKCSHKKFREIVIGSFHPSQFEDIFRIYKHEFDLYLRRKASKAEFEIARNEPNKNLQKKWDIVDSSCTYRENIEKMNTSERVNEIFSFGPPLSHSKFFLSKLINSLGYSSLSKIWKYTIRNTGKEHRLRVRDVNYLTNIFFGDQLDEEEENDIGKRKTEIENISSFEDDGHRFVTLCDIEIPQEVLLHIFSFHKKHDKELLFGVGKICKTFYIAILSSWKKIVIRKSNIYKISVLVLQSCESIQFSEDAREVWEPSNKSKPDSMFRLEEIDHILNQLNPKRLREVIFDTTLNTQLKALRRLYQRKKDLPPGLASVRVLRLSAYSSTKKSYYDSILINSELLLSEIFPKLEVVENPLKFRYLKGLRIRELGVNLDFLGHLINKLGNYRLDESGIFGTRLGDDGLTKESVTKLCLVFGDFMFGRSSRMSMSKFLLLMNSLENLEELKIQGWHNSKGKLILDDIKSSNLRSIIFTRFNGRMVEFPSPYELRNNRTVFSNLNKLILPTLNISIELLPAILELTNLTHFHCRCTLDSNQSIEEEAALVESLEKNFSRFVDIRLHFIWVEGVTGRGYDDHFEGLELELESAVKKFWGGSQRRSFIRMESECGYDKSRGSAESLSCSGIFTLFLPNFVSKELERKGSNNLTKFVFEEKDDIGREKKEEIDEVENITENIDEKELEELKGKVFGRFKDIPGCVTFSDVSRLFLGGLFERNVRVKVLDVFSRDSPSQSFQRLEICQ